MTTDVLISNGTGALNNDYIVWRETTVSLTDSTTNYVYVIDSDGDGMGTVEVNQSGHPPDSVPLWSFQTDNDSVTSWTDDRDKLISVTETNSDLIFSEDFVIDDTTLDLAHILALTDSVNVADAMSASFLKSFSDTISLAEGALSASNIAPFSDTIEVKDGGSPTWIGGVEATVTANLNSQTADLTVYQDTTGDGNADNQETVSLNDGSNTYSLDTLQADSTDTYWIDVSLSTDDDSSTPTVDAVTIDITEPTDKDQNPNTQWVISPGVYDRSGNEYDGGGMVTKYG